MPVLLELIGTSRDIVAVREEVSRLLRRQADGRSLPPILIQGETGTGKGLLAIAIHRAGPRRDAPFVAVNCAAIPDTLLEAELFGFERGAFTDARQSKPGLVQTAHRGTLFLDEIGLLPAPLQGKLLTVLEDKAVRRLGRTRSEPVDIAILAATSEDLERAVRERRFMEALYHRLSVLTLRLPPLRARGADIVLLAEHFLARAADGDNAPRKQLTPEARAALLAYPWPGNVRELSNRMERVTLLAEAGLVTPEMLELPATSPAEIHDAAPAQDARQLRARIGGVERASLIEALAATGGNITRAAARLGIPPTTLRYRLRKYGLVEPPPGVVGPSDVAERVARPASPLAAGGAIAMPSPVQADLPPAQPPETVTDAGLVSSGRVEAEAERRQLTATTLSPSEDEWRPLTVLACQLVGVSGLPAPLDREARLAVVRDSQAMWTEIIQRFDGYLAQSQGERLLVYFGYPRAHEDDARRAVHAGLAMVDGMVAFNRRREHDGGAQLAVRVGIHTGVELVGAVGRGDQRTSLVVGETPTIAAGLQRLAEPDTVVISPATWRLVEGYVVGEVLGTYVLDDIPEPLTVYQVLQESPNQNRLEVAITRGLTPFVGREHEVGLLHECWAQATEGRGQVVVLRGEAGIGKSRLVRVFTEQLAGEAYTRFEYHCSPYYEHTAFYPVVTALQRSLGFRPRESAEEQLRKLEGLLEQSGMGLEEGVPLWAALLSLPLPARYPPLTLTPESQRQKTLEALLAWLLNQADQQPLCVLVEDLQWADASTVEWLTLLIDQVPTARLLLLLVCRTEFPLPGAPRAHMSQVTLRRLSRPHVETMVQQLTDSKALPTEVLQRLVATTDGVPLFVEELTRAVVESGLVKQREGRYELTGPLPQLAIPTTLHDSLMARLDRLGPAKEVAQLGAVVGREFAYEVLHAVSPVEGAVLQQGLAQLVDAELLYQRGLPPHARYTFKHALIQEAAYQSLLRTTRRQYHQQIAQLLEERFPEIRKLHPELLAHHALWGEVWQKALVYWREAGANAFARSARREAVACFEQALVVLQHLPESRTRTEQAFDLRFDLRNALLGLGEQERVLEHMRDAVTLAQTLDDPRRLGRVYWCMIHCFTSLGDHERALESGQQALTVASALEDVSIQVAATEHLGQLHHSLGNYRQAVDLFRWNAAFLQGQRIYEHFGMTGCPSVHSRAWLARCLAELGSFADAIVSGEEAVQIAKSIGQPYSISVAHQGIGFVYFRKGDFYKAIPLLEYGLEICRAASNWDWFVRIALSLSSAYALSGRITEALPLLEQALDQSASMKLMSHHWRWIYWLTEVYPLADRMVELIDSVRRALELSRAHNERGHQAWALRLLAEACFHHDPPEGKQAEAFYREALTIASELGMRPLVAHCRLGLGALYHQMRRLEEARSELSTAAEMYRAMEMSFWVTRAAGQLVV